MNFQASSLIIFLSILTILIQFATYNFFESILILWGVSILISIVCCHILQEQTNTYETCFQFSLLTVFISLIIIIMSFYGNTQNFLPFSGPMLGIAIINWLIPLLHCFIRYMVDYGTRMEDFIGFYRNMSILFLLFYIAWIISIYFVKNSYTWAYPMSTGTYNFMPFNIISTQIEDFIYGFIPLSELVTYLLSRILTFLPYGFYITLLLRNQPRLPRILTLLLLPFVIEVIQFFLIPEYCDIDDLFYGFIGGNIGSLCYYLMNIVFRLFSGKDFLKKDTEYRFSNSNLHF